ncbi:MAG: glycosyltransferase [Anaerolineae bacterium]|nr:glycosyltransferase [Anaerolineae bacterium]
MVDISLISIVLPTYNGERYLDESIQSVIDQTYTHWELIIVDDHSTDNTAQVIAKWVKRDNRIRSIRHVQNKKLPAALNTGFRAAKGDFFSWTSDDNLYRSHALETMLHHLQSHPEVDLIYSDYTLIDDNGHMLREVRVAPPTMLVTKATVDACFLYRRIVHEQLQGYDENAFLLEDYDFWMRASMHFHLQPLHQDLYLYRHHEASLTTLKRRQVMERREAMLIQHLPHLHWATHVHLARGYLHVSELARENGAKRKAIRYVWKSLQYAPFVVVRHYAKALMPKFLLKYAIQFYQQIRRRHSS